MHLRISDSRLHMPASTVNLQTSSLMRMIMLFSYHSHFELGVATVEHNATNFATTEMMLIRAGADLICGSKLRHVKQNTFISNIGHKLLI